MTSGTDRDKSPEMSLDEKIKVEEALGVSPDTTFTLKFVGVVTAILVFGLALHACGVI